MISRCDLLGVAVSATAAHAGGLGATRMKGLEMAGPYQSRTISVTVNRSHRGAYDFASMPDNMHRWASQHAEALLESCALRKNHCRTRSAPSSAHVLGQSGGCGNSTGSMSGCGILVRLSSRPATQLAQLRRGGAPSFRQSPSSRGPGHGPFKAETRVRIPSGTPYLP